MHNRLYFFTVGAFEYCENLTSIEIPNSVTSIGAGTFEHCENLTSIKIPNGIKNIGDYAFENRHYNCLC